MSETIISPTSPEQVVAALKQIVKEGHRVRIQGYGSKTSWGPPSSHTHVLIDTKNLIHGLRHDRDDLVVTVPAGLSWQELQDTLATTRQWVAIDQPLPVPVSVGGVVAAATSGPRRLNYGSVRDQVIGIKAVLADGRQIAAGGRVIKNVAGYDLCKLFVGSFGTLGVITEVTWKVSPLPEVWAALSISCNEINTAYQLGLAIMRTNLQPAAVQVLWNKQGKPVVRVDVDGLEVVVRRQIRELSQLVSAVLTAIGSEAGEIDLQLEGPHEVKSAWDLRAAATAEPAYPSSRHTVIRCGSPAAHWLSVAQLAGKELSPCQAIPLRVDVQTGLQWWCAPALEDTASQALSALAGAVARLDRSLSKIGGYATVQSGPWPVRRWATELQQERLAISERIRKIFDPKGIFSPLPFRL